MRAKTWAHLGSLSASEASEATSRHSHGRMTASVLFTGVFVPLLRLNLLYSTLSVLESFRQDNVVHLELRTTPRAIPDQGITKTQYVETILACIEEHNARPLNTMHTGLILSVDRRNSLLEAEEVVGLALSFQSRGVVGIDLCGDPVKGDVRIFSGVFAKAKAAGMKITVHFAEAAASSTDTELWTLLNWYPDRIGHVIHVKEEIRKRIVEQKIGVELCISCNVHAKMITGSFQDHHFGRWRNSGVGVALSVSDKPHWTAISGDELTFAL
ncbi:hypothetical protein SLS54_009209 [Diplodia seriata]